MDVGQLPISHHVETETDNKEEWWKQAKRIIEMRDYVQKGWEKFWERETEIEGERDWESLPGFLTAFINDSNPFKGVELMRHSSIPISKSPFCLSWV